MCLLDLCLLLLDRDFEYSMNGTPTLKELVWCLETGDTVFYTPELKMMGLYFYDNFYR